MGVVQRLVEVPRRQAFPFVEVGDADDGSLIDYSGVGDEIWRRLSSSGSAWSYYRDNVEEDFPRRKVAVGSGKKPNPLDDLFGK